MKQDEWLKVGRREGLRGRRARGPRRRCCSSRSPTTRPTAASTRPRRSRSRRSRSGSPAADAAGLQVEVHAIGDRANAELLDIFERVAKKNGAAGPALPRSSTPSTCGRRRSRASRELGVIASMQPYHAIDDGRWAEKRHRAASAAGRPTRSGRCSTRGARLAFGSDWDVAPLSPILGIAAAVTRATIDGKNPNGWVPEQKIAVGEALRAYTSTAAYAAFEEKEKGSLAPGKLADFVILSRRPVLAPAAKLAAIAVDVTVVGGRVVHRSR